MNDIMGTPPSYRGALPTITPYTAYKPEFKDWRPTGSAPNPAPLQDPGSGMMSQGAGALGKGLAAAGKPTGGTSILKDLMSGQQDTFGMFNKPSASGLGESFKASYAPSTMPTVGSEFTGGTMSTSLAGPGATISPATPSMGTAAFAPSGEGAGSAMFMNPYAAIPAAIAANEITAYGTDRRPSGVGNQIAFDLAGKAPAADIHALSNKWNLGNFGDLAEGSAKVGASIDPRDWWSGTKQVTHGMGDLFSKGLSGLKSFLGG